MKLFCKNISLFIITAFLPLFICAQKDLTALVNPFIGTGGHGHTFPGASKPFGMMQLSPDTRMADWDGSSGYHYSDSVIYGFSHTHLSGTGIPDYCDLLLMPFTGSVQWEKEKYRSPFSHQNEKASPGFYGVTLDKQNIKVQLTATTRAGMHQYHYPTPAKNGSVLIDLTHRDEVLESSLEKISPFELRGFRRSKSWAQDQYFYFYIKFDQPIKEFVIRDDSGKETKTSRASGKKLKAFIRFDLTSGRILKTKVGISAINEDGAKKNLEAEIKDWNFERLRTEAKKAWNKELSKIEIEGGTPDQQVNFYTALYHTFLVPNVFEDVDGRYRGTDRKVHTKTNHKYYSVFSLWDTYRAYHPLMTIINQQRTKDWIKTFLTQYRHGGMLPVWELAGNETFCMIGYHSVPVILDAWQKGILAVDGDEMLKAMLSYAESDRFGLSKYREFGYLGNDMEHESVSKTLEYAYDDWCIAQFAKLLRSESGASNTIHDYQDIFNRYMERAQYWKNVFDPQTKYMRGKLQSMWHAPFDPTDINNFYTEGNSWQYSFAVPQDVATLIKFHGGKDSFAAKLNELFTTSSRTTGRDQADVTGLIGQYAHGNEPSHHMAYLFNYVGMPWRTQELVNKICTEFYKNEPDGLIGNEDCGQMSAWYILSALGFYPVLPGSGEYVLGTPLFEKATIHLENGKKFTIRANREDGKNMYVQSVRLQNKYYSSSFLLHTDLIKGGELKFVLSPKQNNQWGTSGTDFPHSEINEAQILPVSYIDAPSNKFRDSMAIHIRNFEDGVSHSLIMNNPDQKPGFLSTSTSYTKDSILYIRSTGMLAVDAKKGNKFSKQIRQNFYKIPPNRSIRVLSTVHPMYTAGGPDALIDSIFGTENWRTGEWQSYFDQDFEAIIDLQEVKNIHYVALHVLQDVSPWILYPKEIIFETSNDGTRYTEVARIHIAEDQEMGPARIREMGKTINARGRYVRVKALNGGKLPSWHESAGNGSHLFIGEIIIR